jgi:maltose alpha-D-glucosyltransferase/alpha-amylase
MPERERSSQLEGGPDWYKDAILYEVHVRAFADSASDGVGDFRGLAGKLDYLQDLGVTAIWLLPFYPSPLKDDGYDIADYQGVHPSYGTLADFKYFLREAHRRGLRVITELVLNHTSDQHPWFQRARRAPAGSPHRDFYVWSDTPERYRDARIIFKDFEASNWSWDRIANAYYWHRFYSHQPDLNYDNPEVEKAMFQVLKFWLNMGVDGLRLDAVPYLYEREGTNCENLPETHEALQRLRRYVDNRVQNRMLLAEANQWPEDAVAYFGQGDKCHMAFHFPLMPRMFMAMRMEDRYPIIDILTQTPRIPEICQWALFLRNHDELTLEMVTDEERDYMYRSYANDPQMRINLGIRRRLAPLLGNDRRKIELMNGLLFSLPGTPVIYYGDEIGMGDNVYLGDRNGVRTPMQWNSDRNAGFSRANSQKLYLPVIIDPDFHYEALNVEAQQNNPNSLLWWMKRTIELRRRYGAFGRGTLEFLYPENRKVLAYVRRFQNELILVVANLSRIAQYVELDLSAFKGMQPVELFGQTEFPGIGELPYLLTLGPHAFYWFSLEPQRVADVEVSAATRPAVLASVRVDGDWEIIFREGPARAVFERALGPYLRERRWFAGKSRRIKSVDLMDAVPLTGSSNPAYVVLAAVEYTEGDPELYALALAVASGKQAEQLVREQPHAVVARLTSRGQEDTGVLYEALRDREVCRALLQAVTRRRRFKGEAGELAAFPTRALRGLVDPEVALEPAMMRAEQSNTSVQYSDRLVLKFFRRLDEGVNPELELGSFLTLRSRFENTAPVAGALEYRRDADRGLTLGILHAYVHNEGDAWCYTLDHLGRYFEQVLARSRAQQPSPEAGAYLTALLESSVSDLARELVGPYLESARLIGQRTAEMHQALAADHEDPSFAPEPFTAHYQRSIYQAMRNIAGQSLQSLHSRLRHLPAPLRREAQQVLDSEAEILRRFRLVLERKISAMRIRIHGDYHLAQMLFTGKDFVIIDFEGESGRSISERRLKRSSLRDVAGMLRSFHYAAYTRLFGHEGGVVRREDAATLEPWARFWVHWVSVVFLRSYLERAGAAAFLPKGKEELQVMLQAYLLEKAMGELAYELTHRPDWVRLPLHGILQLLESPV